MTIENSPIFNSNLKSLLYYVKDFYKTFENMKKLTQQKDNISILAISSLHDYNEDKGQYVPIIQKYFKEIVNEDSLVNQYFEEIKKYADYDLFMKEFHTSKEIDSIIATYEKYTLGQNMNVHINNKSKTLKV